MADITSLDEFRMRYVPLQALELHDNPSLAEVVQPLWPRAEDDPDDAA